MLQVEEINDFGKLSGLKKDWNSLLSQSNSNHIFLTFEWVANWWRHCSDEKTLFVLVVRDGDKILGIAPWMVRRGGRKGLYYRCIEFIGTGLYDKTDLILGESKERAIEAMLDHLARRSDAWTLADFREMDLSSGNAAILEGAFRRAGFECETYPDSVCPYIPISSDWESFYKNVFKSGTRRGRAKRLRALQRRGSVEFSIAKEVPEVEKLLLEIAEVEGKLAKHAGQTRRVFTDDRVRAFLADVTRDFTRNGWFHVALLRFAGRTVAYQFAFQYAGKYWGYQKGYDPEFSSSSPGTMLLSHVVQDCFERGMTEFDLLCGNESWKFEWTSATRQNVRLLIWKSDVRSKFLSYLYRRSRQLNGRVDSLARETGPGVEAGMEERQGP